MAITILLCSTGVLPIYLGIALVMGENIGTTATVNLAALGANTQARRAAFAHLLFNVFGVVWVLCLFYPFVDMVCRMVGYDPESTTLSAAQKATILPIVLAMFHTCFNVCNTAVLIWFIPQMERVVCWIIKAKANKEDDEFRLRFIQAGVMKTPELSVLEASKEIHAYAEFTQHMFGMVRDLLTIKEDDAFEQLFDRIDKYEDRSDDMEVEIAKYLDQVSDAHLSDDTKEKVRQMLREISEIESIGDSCLHIARTIGRRRAAKEEFTEAQFDNINQMFELVDDALTQMGAVLVKHKNEVNVDRSFTMENQINNYRSQLRTQNITDVNDHKYTYTIGTMYMDIIQECERLGDFIINVVQARMCMK